MTKELTELSKTLKETRLQFKAAADKATKALTREAKRLRMDIKKANARLTRTRLQIRKKTERLAKTTAAKAEKELKGQIAALKKAADEARQEAKSIRADLGVVGDDLGKARHHFAHALHIDRALDKIEKQLGMKKKVVKKKVAKKKVAKKKAAPKKAAKKAAKKKASKKVVAKKVIAKKATVKEATAKKAAAPKAVHKPAKKAIAKKISSKTMGKKPVIKKAASKPVAKEVATPLHTEVISRPEPGTERPV